MRWPCWLAVAASGLSLGCASSVEPTKSFVLRIDQPTTHIVAPLDSEGFVDYVEAVNLRHGQGVDPEDNWEVVIRRAFGPLDWDTASDAEYYRRLGIAPVPNNSKDGKYFQALSDYGPNTSDERERRVAEYWKMLEGPWRAEDLPQAASWLRTHSELLDRLVAGSHVSRCYIPYVMSAEAHSAKIVAKRREFRDFVREMSKSGDSGEKFGTAIVASLLGDAFHRDVAPLSRWHTVDIRHQSVEAGRFLRARANLRIGEGDVSGAQSDLLAIHRIARLLCQGTHIDWDWGLGQEQMACHGAMHLLESGKLTQEASTAYLASLDALPPFPSAAEKTDVSARHHGLDAMQYAARRRDQMLEATEGGDTHRELANAMERVDWNEAMRLLNQQYDEYVAALQEPDSIKRMASADKLRPQRVNRANKAWLEELKKAAHENKDLTPVVVDMFIDRYHPVFPKGELRAQAYLMVIRASLAAVLYYKEHGAYPRAPNDLVGRLGELPLDPLTGEPVRFRTTDDWFVVYSVGQNQVDEGGFDANGTVGTEDDLGVRLTLRTQTP